MKGKWLLIGGLLLLLFYLSLRERERCQDPTDVWVLSDRGWVCVRPTLIR